MIYSVVCFCDWSDLVTINLDVDNYGSNRILDKNWHENSVFEWILYDCLQYYFDFRSSCNLTLLIIEDEMEKKIGINSSHFFHFIRRIYRQHYPFSVCMWKSTNIPHIHLLLIFHSVCHDQRVAEFHMNTIQVWRFVVPMQVYWVYRINSLTVLSHARRVREPITIKMSSTVN